MPSTSILYRLFVASTLLGMSACATAVSPADGDGSSNDMPSQSSTPSGGQGGGYGNSQSSAVGGNHTSGGDSSTGATGNGSSGSGSSNSSGSTGQGGQGSGSEHSNCSITNSNTTCATCLQTWCCEVINACMDEDILGCVGCMDCFLEGKGPGCCDQSIGKNAWMVECVEWNCKKECK